MKKRVIVAGLFIFAGLLIMAYPFLKAHFFEQRKNQVIEQWLNVMLNGENPSLKKLLPENIDNNENNENEEKFKIVLMEQEEDTPLDNSTKPFPDNMEGVLYINSIDLKSPVLFGESKKNLDLGICRMYSSADAGGYGNLCLSGHNSRIYGRHFNRLKEISIGDTIIIFMENAVYNYITTNTFTVKPEDIWVLENNLSKKEITLITCDYSLNPTGRFIVKGELIEE